ncbi:MAG: hypothetical protein U5K29_07445 [Acidimicrobiales bacterium]|nr:hypothetical protein [Acidimicrobiales bacterium]
MSWWVIGLILMAGICVGLLLARIERVRIRSDEPASPDEQR